jgi:hypothetical protein
MEMIGRLGIGASLEAHLLPRGREELVGGQQRTIPPGVLQPGDLIVCRTSGRLLEHGVPIETEMVSSTGYGGARVPTVWLRVTRHADGSITATCT